MLKMFVVGCVLLTILSSVQSHFKPDPEHMNDCYHPVDFKYFAVDETIQTGRCSIATCKAPPFDIEETLCDSGPTKINYKSGCYDGKIDYSKDYPACCERALICV